MSHAALLESVPIGLLTGLPGAALGWLLRGLYERRRRAEHRRLLVSLLDEARTSTGGLPAAAPGTGGCTETDDTRVYVRPVDSAHDTETAVFCMSAEMQALLGREH